MAGSGQVGVGVGAVCVKHAKASVQSGRPWSDNVNALCCSETSYNSVPLWSGVSPGMQNSITSVFRRKGKLSPEHLSQNDKIIRSFKLAFR